jgi:hypothetical protein
MGRNATLRHGGKTMTKTDKEMWRINIENDADEVCSIYGAAAVDGVFQRYDATCFDDLSPSYYEEVFGDLELMIYDN